MTTDRVLKAVVAAGVLLLLLLYAGVFAPPSGAIDEKTPTPEPTPTETPEEEPSSTPTPTSTPTPVPTPTPEPTHTPSPTIPSPPEPEARPTSVPSSPSPTPEPTPIATTSATPSPSPEASTVSPLTTLPETGAGPYTLRILAIGLAILVLGVAINGYQRYGGRWWSAALWFSGAMLVIAMVAAVQSPADALDTDPPSPAAALDVSADEGRAFPVAPAAARAAGAAALAGAAYYFGHRRGEAAGRRAADRETVTDLGQVIRDMRSQDATVIHHSNGGIPQ